MQCLEDQVVHCNILYQWTVWSYDNRETQYTKFVCGEVQIPSATGNTNARQLGEISAASATTWYPAMSRIIADPIIAGTEYNIAGIDYVGILYAYPTGGNGNNSMKDIVLS